MKNLVSLCLLAVAAFGGCTNTVSNPQPESQSPEETPPASPTANTRRTPEAVGSLPQAATMAPFHFYVSNQSFDLDPVDIDIYVDGVKLITGDFVVQNQHTWVRFDFSAEAGKNHTVRAVTKKGGVDKTEVVTVPSAGRWVVVSFWYVGPAQHTPTPQSFTIEAFDNEPGFM